jgi:ornithine cyclodeaminase/alanine dehydrogenase-like protein (mu-crystallin family)
MLYFTEEAVRQHLPWRSLAQAIESKVGQPDVAAPRRLSFELGASEGLQSGRLLIMPSWNAEAMVGIKTVVYRPDNLNAGLPTHGANYLLMNARSGLVEAVLEAHELTTRRTAAVSALAARYLARGGSGRLLIVGSGPVAHALADAHASLRPLESIQVFGRTRSRLDAMITALQNEGIGATRCDDLRAATQHADIICMATSSTEPLIKGEWLRPGVHIDLIGSFTPAMREVDDVLMRRADAIWVDTLAAAQESGDLVGPIAAGVIREQDICGDLGKLVAGETTKRRSESDITVFKAVGLALCDLAAAELVVSRATPEAPRPLPE